MGIELVATYQEGENNLREGTMVVDPDKLHSIYRELRDSVFVGEPIQDNSGDNNIVFSDRMGPSGNYGWQLFKTREGTAMLEYQGPVSYWQHERKPLPMGEEKHLRAIWITFHQKEKSVGIAQEIIKKHTKKRVAI